MSEERTKYEKDLINEIRNGSESSFGILYRQWVSRLYQFVFHYIKSESITDDIVQETFVRVWENRKHLNADKSFKSYLFTISYHLLIKELRRQLINPQLSEWIESNNEQIIILSCVENKLDFDTFVKDLNISKKHLSPRQREIFEMNKERGLSIEEISKRLNITQQVVRNQLSTALKIIRAHLTPYSIFFFILF